MATSRPPTRLDAGCIKQSAFEYYDRLGKVRGYIVEHYAEDVTLSTAANVACLEEKYFSSFFHKKTGVRYVDFLSYVRVERAKQLFRQHDTTISAAATAVGYHNRRTFERAFKKWTGVTPRRFRAAVRPC